MKQATKTVLPVVFGINLDEVEQIEFRFEQHGKPAKRLEFTYPSDAATRDGTNTVNLKWSREQTSFFPAAEIEMDTRITLKNSDCDPETEIVKFKMERSLFKEEP